MQPRLPHLASPMPYTTLFRSLHWAGGLILFADGDADSFLELEARDRYTRLPLAFPRDLHRAGQAHREHGERDRKSTRLNSSHLGISYAVFCLKKKNNKHTIHR